MVDFKRLQGTIVSTVLESPSLEETCDLSYFVDSDEQRYHQGTVRLAPNPAAHVVFGVPLSTRNIYVGIATGAPTILRRMIAQMEEHDRKSGRELAVGEVFRFEGPDIERAGAFGLVLVNTFSSALLGHIPETIECDGDKYRFILACHLSEEEYRMWRYSGFDALMKHFDDIDKDVAVPGG